jgi:TRAP-type transport system periplasmic protein
MKRLQALIPIVVVILLVASALMVACTPPAPTKIYEFKYASTNAATHPQSVADIEWMNKIAKDSNGAIKITPYWGGALMKSDTALTELAKGVADISEFSGAYAKDGYDFEKIMRIWFYGAKDLDTARKVYDEVRAKYPILNDEFKSIKPLAYHAVSPYQLVTVKAPVRKPDDMKGMNIKTTGEFNRIAGAFGAQGQTIAMAETYVALQKGTVDGAFTPWETLKSFKFAEVVKYGTELGMTVGPTPHRGMNWDSYKSLPANLQKVIDDSILGWGKAIENNLYAADAEGVALAKQNKVEFIKMSDADLAKFFTAVDKVALEEAVKLDAKNLQGTTIYKEIRALLTKYK